MNGEKFNQLNQKNMETFRFRYAMAIDINASSKAEAKKIFGTMDFNKLIADSEYVELEDISENW